MSEKPNVLLVDSGNTNVKLCLMDSHGEYTLLENENDVSISLLNQYGIQRVLLCSVRAPSYAESVKHLCEENLIDYEQIKTTSEAFGVRCAYENFHTLGVDRWMGVLAAAHNNPGVVISISIGTAMTVDVINQRTHLGGWITPGFDLSKAVLLNKTENVFGNNLYPRDCSFGKSTEDCVNNGGRAIVNGLLREALHQTGDTLSPPKIVVTGGGSPLVDRESFENLQIDDLWVFKGMSRFI